MDIISKQTGPRREDVQAKQHISRNWGTIEKLADQISNGRYSADKAKKAAPPPQASGKVIIDQAAPAAPDVIKPYLRISVNGRVIVADVNSGRQLNFLGQLKRVGGIIRFVIATKENGFFSPVDDETYDMISDLGGKIVNRSFSEKDLELELKARLNIT
ncbi:MAG: hypothetical protein JKY94_07600 [Rhodobacteraceae bacterium]|nr:hypothetical protein [Paracoccaceae bacterium]